MDIDVSTCIKKLQLVGVLNFATVDEEGAPQVRNISAIHWEEDGSMYFLTARGKSFAHQLEADGRVQVSAYTRFKETIRLSGRAQRVCEGEQRRWRDVLYAEQPALENVYPGESKNIDVMYVVRDYTIEYFCLSTRPITRYYFAVGDARVKPKGYRIDEGSCIGCCTCQRFCPQGCIDGGVKELHRIDQNHCLQCGNCFEHCPVRCVEHLG